MKNKIINLIDFEKVNVLLEGFNKTTGFVTAILDPDGNVLSKSGWRQICTQFHRVHPDSSKNCTISDTELASKMEAGEKYHFYKCLNGLIDVAIPLVINGEHIANLFTGQFFFEKPDVSFFKKQAQKYGFSEKIYLEALDKVPVVSEKEVKTAMEFLLNMTELIVQMTVHQLEQKELTEALQNSEEKYRLLHESAGVGIGYYTTNGIVISYNAKAGKNMGGKPEDFVGKSFFDLFPKETAEFYLERIKKATISEIPQEYIDEVHLLNESKWFNSIYTRILDSNQKITGIQIISTDITERKKAEIELLESKSFFEQLFIQSSTSTQLLDKEGWCIKINPKLSELFGVLPEHIEGKKYNILKDDEIIRTGVIQHLKKVFEKKETVRWEVNFDIQHASESTGVKVSKPEKRWFWNIAYPIFDAQGELIYVIVQHEDITDRKIAEKALKESEERLRLSTELANVAVWEFDFRTNNMTRSNNHDQLYGLEFQEKWEPEIYMNVMHPDDKGLINNMLHQSIAVNGPNDFSIDFRVFHPDKSIHWLMVTGKVAERNSEGKGVLVRGVIIDITERKILEEEIVQKNKNLESLLKTSQEISKYLNLESVLNNIIVKAVKLIGLDTGAIYLVNGEQLYMGSAFPSIPADFPETFRHALLKEHPHIQQCIFKGRPIIIKDLDKAVLSPAEEVIRESRNMRTLLYVPLKIEHMDLGVMILGTTNNIRIFSEDEINLYQTMSGQAAMAIYNSQLFEEINKLNEKLEQRVKNRTAELSESQEALLNLVEDLNEKSKQLEQSTKLLEAKNKELETFTYSVSHDLKAPLRGIDGYSRLLEELYSEKLNDEAIQFIHTIRNGTKHMYQLIEDLLAYSRLERSTLNFSVLNVNDLMENILTVFETEIKSKNIIVNNNLNSCKIFADSNGVSIVLRNIIENAIKFTRDVESPEINIKFQENSTSQIISISDNGIGFDMIYKDRIFEIFQQLNLPEDYPGTGIGLAMVSKSMERMGGNAWAKSNKGEGAVFYLEFPKNKKLQE